MGGVLLFDSKEMAALEEEFIKPVNKLVNDGRNLISIFREDMYNSTARPVTTWCGIGIYSIGTINEKRGWVNSPIAGWQFVEMPGCCGIVISTGAYVYHELKNKGIGTLLNEYRKRVAKVLGYGLLICTDVLTNEPQQKILAKNGWNQISSFKNPRTSNVIGIHEVVL